MLIQHAAHAPSAIMMANITGRHTAAQTSSMHHAAYDWRHRADCQLCVFAAADLQAIGRQYPFEPFRWLPTGASKVLRLNFEEAIQILQENGFSEVKLRLHLHFHEAPQICSSWLLTL